MGKLVGERLEALRCLICYVSSCIKNRNAFTFETASSLLPRLVTGVRMGDKSAWLSECRKACWYAFGRASVYTSLL